MTRLKGRRETKKTQTREKILLAASELFFAQDFSKVKTKEIAERVQVSMGSVFFYFSSKDKLGFAVIERALEHYKEFIPLHEDIDSRKILGTFIEKSLEISYEKPGFIRMLIHLLLLLDGEEKSETHRRLEEVTTNNFLPYIETVVNVFVDLKVENPKMKAVMLLALIDGLSVYMAYNERIAKMNMSLSEVIGEYQDFKGVILDTFIPKEE